MSTAVFLDGRFVSRDDARVSAFDAGFQHGVGLFETMLGVGGDTADPRVVGLVEHLDRLKVSANELGLSDDLRTEPLADAVIETLAQSGLARARLRLTLTGGDLNMLERGGRSQHTPTLLINATPATDYPEEMFSKGVAVALADSRANPLDPTAGHKTLNYWWRLRELQKAAARGAGEALVFGVTNHLCGGAVSNVFLVKDGTLFTPIAHGEEEAASGGKPALPSPVLPGITRMLLIDAAERMGIGTAKKMLTYDDLRDADEVFLTNSSWGVLPVIKAEAEDVGGGAPGSVTKELRAAWFELCG